MLDVDVLRTMRRDWGQLGGRARYENPIPLSYPNSLAITLTLIMLFSPLHFSLSGVGGGGYVVLMFRMEAKMYDDLSSTLYAQKMGQMVQAVLTFPLLCMARNG